MEPWMIGIIGIVLLMILLSQGVTIFACLMIPGLIGTVAILGPDAGISMLVRRVTSFCSSYSLSVIPVFILMGYLALAGGISEELYDFAHKWVGRLAGGLSTASIVACGLFGAITGSSGAATVAIGSVGLPEMRKHGYDDALSTATIAAGGTIARLIPPSIAAVIYATIVSGSVGKQLMAGFIPGIITVLLFSLMVVARCYLNPKLGPRARGVSWKESVFSTWKILPPLVVFTVMFGGMFAGFFTPTEAGSMGVVAIFAISLIRRRTSWSQFKEALWSTVTVTAMVFGIVVGAAMFASLMTLSRLPVMMVDFVTYLELPRMAALTLLLLPFIPVGMIIDEITMMLVMVPVILPAVKAYGFDLIWFGVIIMIITGIAVLTPPVGVNLFYAKAVAGGDVKFETIARGSIWFVIAYFIILIIVIAFPPLSLWLPNLMY